MYLLDYKIPIGTGIVRFYCLTIPVFPGNLFKFSSCLKKVKKCMEKLLWLVNRI